MKYTQKWTWQNQKTVASSRYEYRRSMIGGQYHRGRTCIQSTAWMQDYRNRIRAIDTQEKAAQAIREYWAFVAADWDNGNGILHH